MKNTLLLFALFLVCYSCTTSPSDTNTTTIKATSTLDLTMDSLHSTGVFNGFAAAVVDSTGILYNQGFGYADVSSAAPYTPNTVINIASISKVFIGVALLKAAELDLVDLEDPINKYLPFEVTNPNYPNDPITVRHLATHTSSIVDTDMYMKTCYINQADIPIADELSRYEAYYQNTSDKWMPLNEYLRRLLTKEDAFYDASTFANSRPGEIHEYSNIGAALCALVIEYASGVPFDQFTKDHIFDPLNMASTTWRYEEADTSRYSTLYYDQYELPYYQILSYPDGGLITSSTDLSLFLVELIKGYTQTGTLLSVDSYMEFFRSQLAEEAFQGKENYNVGVFTEKEIAYHVIGHSGGDPGTNTMMFFDTENKVGKIFITNTDSKKENSKALMWGIWNALDLYE